MLNVAEEQKFADLRNKCRDLRVPSPPEIHIGLKVHDKDGNLTFEDVQRGHSWTRNYWNALLFVSAYGSSALTASFGAGFLALKGSNASLYSQVTYGASLIMSLLYSGPLASAYGLVIGTGAGASSTENYAMGALIANGAGSGQMAYQANNTVVTAYTSGTKTWKATHARVFNNNSGGSITVAETGFYSSGGTGFTALIERSVLSPAVAVGNGAQLTVTYEISMDFSAID